MNENITKMLTDLHKGTTKVEKLFCVALLNADTEVIERLRGERPPNGNTDLADALEWLRNAKKLYSKEGDYRKDPPALDLRPILKKHRSVKKDADTSQVVSRLEDIRKDRKARIDKLRREIGNLNREIAAIQCPIEDDEVLMTVSNIDWLEPPQLVSYGQYPMWRVMHIEMGRKGPYVLLCESVEHINSGISSSNHRIDPFAKGNCVVVIGKWNAHEERVEYYDNPRLIGKPQLLEE